jgi:signal transduction histidine kinase
MTTAAKAISANDLHRRLDAQGPDDEIKELADTFDELLAHLEDAFEAQRRFVANASHELRTPLTFERSLLEVALADPDITCSDLRAVCQRVLVSNQQQGGLIEALLALARSQRGMQHRAALDLAILAGRALADTRDGTIEVDVTLNSAPVSGDPALIERLIANLVDNALRHNVTNGSVTVSTGVVNGLSALRVRNTGPVIQPDEVDSLFEPFQRLHATRTHGHDGAGVGLSIVAAIAKAHGATITAQPGAQGGLSVNVTFPTPTTHTVTLNRADRSDVGKCVT